MKEEFAYILIFYIDLKKFYLISSLSFSKEIAFISEIKLISVTASLISWLLIR